MSSESAVKNPQRDTSRWMTVEEVADYLQASKEKIYKLCQRGKMPASKFGNQWRFKKDVIDHWMLGQQKSTKAK
jgi:excisionase family DNA binding protein